MPAVGGPLVDFNIGGRSIAPDEAAEVNFQLGGDNNDVLMNGDKSGRLIKTIVPWSADGIVLKNDHDKEDQEYLQDIANRKAFASITFGLASGAIYQGDGQITGEIVASSKNATVSFAVKGTGTLTQQ